jgi:hypothetical protein
LSYLATLFVFLMITILIGVRWNLGVVLICMSLMAKDIKPFLSCVYWPFVLLRTVY